MSRYGGFKNPNQNVSKFANDDRIVFLREGTNKWWILPTIENEELFFYPFFVHKVPSKTSNQIDWVECPRRTTGADCPICTEATELWNSGIEENQDFAKTKLFVKTKYLLNVVPCDNQDVKIAVLDPRIVGFLPKFVDGEPEKIFDGSSRLIKIHLAIDQEAYEKDGTETYICPEIVGKDATYVIINRTKNSSSYDTLTVSVPQLAKQRKALPNYEEQLANRYNLHEYSKEIVTKLTHPELVEEIKRLLCDVETTENEESQETETETETETTVQTEEPTAPDCFGDYGSLPNGVCDKVCNDWRVACKEEKENSN